MSGILPFVVVAVGFNLAPGPDVALVVRQTLAGGRRLGLAVAAGAAIGSLVWGTAAIVGLAELIERWPLVYRGLTYGGATYLLVLGMRSLLRPPAVAPVGRQAGSGRTAWGGFGVGLGADLLNPKVGGFYLALLPQFVRGADLGASAVGLVAIECTIAVLCMSGYAVAADRVAPVLHRPGWAWMAEALVGVALVGAGLQVALLGH